MLALADSVGIVRLIWPVLGSISPEKRHVLVLDCYLDDSDDKDDPAIVMAGYLSSLSSWAIFEDRARPFLDAHGVEHLHAMDFHNRRKWFKGWEYPKRAKFLTELYEILRPCVVLAIGVATYKNQHKKRKTELRLSNQQSPYGFCFSVILSKLFEDRGVKLRLSRGSDLSFIIEEGNKHNAGVFESFQRIKKQHKLDKAKSMTFADKESSIAIQMADMYAFYLRREVAAIERAGRQRVSFDPMFQIMTNKIKCIGIAATDFHSSRDRA